MASKSIKQFKQRVNSTKVENIKQPSIKSYSDYDTKVVIVNVNPTNRIKVVVSKGISIWDVKAQMEDLIKIGVNISQKRINLSQFTNCCYDLLFNRQQVVHEKENNIDILESYFCTV